MKSIKHRGAFVTIPFVEFRGVYQLNYTFDTVPPMDAAQGPACDCCRQPQRAAFDVMQMGFWDDSYQTYFICPSCKTASVYKYKLSRIEPVKERKAR